MKQLAKYLLPLCCGIALASCYGLDKEEYRELAPITVSGLDRTIYAKATETLHLDKLRVESESGQDPVYEWSYGKPAGDFPGMSIRRSFPVRRRSTTHSTRPAATYCACGSTTAKASDSITTTCACRPGSTKGS